MGSNAASRRTPLTGNRFPLAGWLAVPVFLAMWIVPAQADDLLAELFRDPGLSEDAVMLAQQTPPPAPDEGAATTPPVDATTQRLYNLETEFQTLRRGLLSGELVPGRLRSTDIAPVVPSGKEPSFPNVKLTGFFQADAGWIAQDTNSLTQFGDIPDSRGFRRARLAAVGDVTKNVSYMLEMDFAQPGRPSFQDLWLDVHEVPYLGNVRVGQWRQPFGMEALTSVRELSFLERALPFAFVPFRQIGVGFHDTNEEQTVTWALSGFGFPTDTFGDSIGDSGYGAAGRVTAIPYFEDGGNRLVHVGFDYCLELPTDGALRYRNVPEFGGPFGGPAGTTGVMPAFVDTGVLSANSSNLINAELATVNGSFYTQSELTYAFVNLASGQSATFPGLYTQACYLLTGEVRPYNKVAGVLGRIKPRCPWGPEGYGAWELAARYSYMDLNGGGVGGGRINNGTAGVNWYLNQFTKLQFNYIFSDLNRAPGGHSNANIAAIRAQVDF